MSESALPAVRPRRRTIATIIVGNFVEYYDWLAFAILAPLFAEQFFPSANRFTSLLGVFAIFGAGMLCRPIGGIVLGRIGDRHGRKPAMVIAIALMAGGSIAIAITPTYESVGLFAALVLLIARSAQGVSSGGEGPTAMTYLMEMAPEKRKVFYASLFSMSATAGGFAASLLAGGLTSGLGADVMREWGWRVPFFVGGVLGVVVMIARRQLSETTVFQREVRHDPKRGSLRRLLGTHWRRVALAVLVLSGLAAVNGSWSAMISAMGEQAAGPDVMLWAVTVVTGTSIVVMPLLGLLADWVGPMRFLTVVSVAFAIIAPYAYLGVIGDFGFLVFAYGTGWLFVGCFLCVAVRTLTGIFPPEVRALGVGLPAGVTMAVLAGLAPLAATYLGGIGASAWFVGGLSTLVVVSLIAALIANRTYYTVASQVEPSLSAEPEPEPEAVAGAR